MAFEEEGPSPGKPRLESNDRLNHRKVTSNQEKVAINANHKRWCQKGLNASIGVKGIWGSAVGNAGKLRQ
jgi:hypothetical protein